VTVEAILEAAARILDRQGWARFTTNAVAEAAGVSIGSLYQYFPNKLALVEAILRRHFDDVLSVLRVADEHTSRVERIEGLVSGMIAAHSIHPSLHRVLLEDVPRGKISKSVHQKFESEYSNLYTRLIAARNLPARIRAARSECRCSPLRSRGWFTMPPGGGTLRSPALKRELVLLVDAYLTALESD